MLDTLWKLGVNLVVPELFAHVLSRFERDVPVISFGEHTDKRAWATTGNTSPLESSTGLSVAGAHVIIHLVNKPHAFGNPLVPLARWCIDEQVFSRFPDDFDGMLTPNFSKDSFVEALSVFVNGQFTVAEELGMDDFALYRIGPTV